MKMDAKVDEERQRGEGEGRRMFVTQDFGHMGMNQWQ